MATHSSILAGKSHGQRSLAGYSPWGCRESDATERLTHTMGFPQAVLIKARPSLYCYFWALSTIQPLNFEEVK